MNESKLKVISKMLSVDAADADAGEGPEGSCTVFELSGTDRPGLMSHCMDKLATNGCDVRSAAVWTDNGRVAFVFAVVERDSGLPLRDKAKMASLRGLLLGVLDPTFARPGAALWIDSILFASCCGSLRLAWPEGSMRTVAIPCETKTRMAPAVCIAC